MKNVLLVGAGNLGRRHLQSLIYARRPIRIIVVERSDAARLEAELSLKKSEEHFSNREILFYPSLLKVDHKVDIVIDATPATGRLGVLRSVLALGAEALVLEKVAFNSIADIDEAGRLVEQSKANVWINCPRRLNPFYIKLYSALSNERIIGFEVSGASFGMACNAIHFIDLFAFLSRRERYNIYLSEVSCIAPSKRESYVEFFGEIFGSFESGPDFKIICRNQANDMGFSIKISTLSSEFLIDEINGRVIVFGQDGVAQTQHFRQPYQSELTGPLIDEIIDSGKCGLTNFKESMALHRPFIAAAYSLYSSAYGENQKKMVPVT